MLVCSLIQSLSIQIVQGLGSCPLIFCEGMKHTLLFFEEVLKALFASLSFISSFLYTFYWIKFLTHILKI